MDINDFNSLLSKYQHKGILVDTNILVLWFVGTANRERIAKFKRTETFLPEDYDLLVKVLNRFSKMVTTPNILTEVNSLINQNGEPDRSRCLEVFAQTVAKTEEFYIESSKVVTTNKFTTFGLTDCSIINLAKDNYLVLTDDFTLADYLGRQEVDVINFNHIRVLGWNMKKVSAARSLPQKTNKKPKNKK